MPETGGINNIKDLFKTIISDSSDSLTSDSVTCDSDKINDYAVSDNIPFVTIYIGNSIQQNVYGRKTPYSGVYEEKPFTLTIFHYASTGDGEKRFQDIFDLADEIKDYLITERTSFQDDGILDIYNLTDNESDFNGAGVNLVTYMIRGYLLVLRKDPRQEGFPFVLPYTLA